MFHNEYKQILELMRVQYIMCQILIGSSWYLMHEQINHASCGVLFILCLVAMQENGVKHPKKKYN